LERTVGFGDPGRRHVNREKKPSGYEGPAELVWGSWVIEGTAAVRLRTSQEVPGGSCEGLSTDLAEPVAEGFVGSFSADSGTEPMLLSSLASALGEGYTLRWKRDGRDESLPVTVTAKHLNRIHFETRG
jgi:hypothetical protein